MELRSWRYFLAVAEAGSVTAAADVVHVTQPSLSRQLRAFESALGLTLFDRDGRRLALSPAGRRLLPVARDLIARADLARQAARELAAGALPSMLITATGTTLTDVIAPFLATWTPGDPLASVREELPAQIYDTLGRGADLAIGTSPPPPQLTSLPLATLPVWAYVSPGHQLAATGAVDLSELVREDLLLPIPDQHARRALDVALEHAGLALDSFAEFDVPEVAQALAAAGRGVAVVSDDERFGLSRAAILTGQRRLSVRLYAAWPADHHAAATLKQVALRLRDFSAQRYGRDTEEPA